MIHENLSKKGPSIIFIDSQTNEPMWTNPITWKYR